VDTYEQWLRRFLRFHQLRHPREMGSEEVNAFLTHLAVEGQVSASTQNQALEGVVRGRQKRRLPVVLTPGEVRAVLERMDGVETLVSEVLYGSGLRLMEALRLRVKDLDFERRELTVRDGKGGKDRRTMLPLGVGERLSVCNYPERSAANTGMLIRSGTGSGCSLNTSAGGTRKQESRAGIISIRAWCKKRFGALCSRQRSANVPLPTASAIPLPPTFSNVAMIQELLGHNDIRTTMIYTHVLNRGQYGISSPADSL
jgi:integrase